MFERFKAAINSPAERIPTPSESPTDESVGPDSPRTPTSSEDSFSSSNIKSRFPKLSIPSPFAKKSSDMDKALASCLREGQALPTDVQAAFKKVPAEQQKMISSIVQDLSNTNASQLEEIKSRIGNLGAEHLSTVLGPDDFKKVNQTLLDLVENRSGINNIQFHTDSIRTLNPESTEGKKVRFEQSEQKTEELAKSNPVLGKQLEDAKGMIGEDTRWSIGARTPGVGLLTHAGWKDGGIPEEGKPQVFKSTRTLGLSLGEQISAAEIPLDFSTLGPIDRKTAQQLIEEVAIVAADNADPAKKNSALEQRLQKLFPTEPEKVKIASEVISKFVNQCEDEIRKLHKAVTA